MEEMVTSEELAIEAKVQEALKDKQVKIEKIWDRSVNHKADLPFQVHKLPTNQTRFRELIKDTKIRPTLPKMKKGSLQKPQNLTPEEK